MAKLNDIRKVFCLRPWHESSMATTGEATICHAQMRGPEKGFPKTKDGKTMSIETHSANEILDSQLHRDIRLSQFQGRWHENCDNCRLKEAASDNTMFRVPGRLDDIKRSLDNMNPDGSMKKTSITRLDVRFSNLCNAACLHCGAVASSKWYDEHYGFFGEEYSHKSASKWSLILDEHGRPRPANPRNTDDMPGFWRTLEEHKETINYVIILGGEPLIMPEHESLLNFFIHHGTSANVVLFYHTNLSVVNKKLIDLWKKFKRVDLSVSIDDIGSNYELIRHGLSWNKLNSNIETLRDNGIELLNLSICYMIPNMLRLREIDEWYDSKGYAKSMKFVHEPFYMTVNSLPRSAREELININRSHGTTFALESANWIEQQIDQPGDPAACDQFVRFMDYLDKSRKQDWRSALKETADFLKRYDIG